MDEKFKKRKEVSDENIQVIYKYENILIHKSSFWTKVKFLLASGYNI